MASMNLVSWHTVHSTVLTIIITGVIHGMRHLEKQLNDHDFIQSIGCGISLIHN